MLHVSNRFLYMFRRNSEGITNLKTDIAPVQEDYMGLDGSRSRRPLAVFVRLDPVRVEGKVTDAAVGDRAERYVASYRLRGAEVARVDEAMRDAAAAVVVDEQYWRVEDAVDEEAGPVEDDGDDAVDTFNQSLLPM